MFDFGYHPTFTERQSNADASSSQFISRVSFHLVLDLLLEVLYELGEVGFCISISISHAAPDFTKLVRLRPTVVLQGCA